MNIEKSSISTPTNKLETGLYLILIGFTFTSLSSLVILGGVL